MGEKAVVGGADREMSLRYAGVCTGCGQRIPRGTRAVYSSATRTVRHRVCPGLDRGDAGASARREHERRTALDAAAVRVRREQVRGRWGDGFVGRVAQFLTVDDRPRRTTEVWAQGAVGEQRVAEQLDRLAEVGVVALHDRRVAGTRANIDHLAVTPWGVWVIDAKRYLGKRPSFVVEGGFLGFGGTNRLTVGGRRRDQLVDGVLRQVGLVREVIGDETPVRGALAFVDAEWPLIGGDFTIRDVRVLWPRRLAKAMLRAEPPTVDAESLAARLAAHFPPA